jgi:uncharacterized protein
MSKILHNKSRTKSTDKPNLAELGQNWPNILFLFTHNYRLKFTASQIANKTKIPLRTVSRTLNNLVKFNLIRYLREGTNKKYYFDLTSERTRLLLQVVENYKSLDFSFKHPSIYSILEELNREIVLFGSYAKGTATNKSDVDIIVFGTKSKEVLKLLQNNTKEVNVHFFTWNQFGKMLNNKEALALEILKNHLVFGENQFLNLCWRHYSER